MTFRRQPAQLQRMKHRTHELTLLGLLAVAPAVAWAGSPSTSVARAIVDIREEPATQGALVPGRALVELFTSQGCSSCPVADRLMSRLGREDAEILAFHVDYWNYIGWTDPFSSRHWSERQSAYAAVWKEARVYTPQAVVDGQLEGVGSDERWLRGALRQLLGAQRARNLQTDQPIPAKHQYAHAETNPYLQATAKYRCCETFAREAVRGA